MHRPTYLKAGDKVRIISTARKVTPEDMDKAASILNEWGLQVVFGNNLFEDNHQFAGTDAQRAADLQAAIDDPHCKAIFCARGGYGSMRIINAVNWSNIISSPKWLIGFSDISVLLFRLYYLGIESIHGIMPGLFSKDKAGDSVDMLRRLLFSGPEPITAPESEFSRHGEASGRLVGGNLSMISIMEGTSFNVPSVSNILFIEDLDEYLYHVDRMMVHLKLSGVLESLAGLVVGQMSGMNDNPIPFGKQAYQIIHEHVKEYQYPVGYNFNIGHDYPNHPVIHGAKCTLKVTSEGNAKLSFD
ncbi:LD-carboxypeptidase [Roseivirga sp. BDSF3-8]|uniref:S66 peptidase family protein n=1 Tax=Roseivirga sp. BDSF3-8 TaxID=3241598 RepID=UPI003531AEE8